MKKQEKIIEEIEIKHNEVIKGLYDDRKVQLQRLMSEKEEVTVEFSRKYEEFQTEIEKYKKINPKFKKTGKVLCYLLIILWFFMNSYEKEWESGERTIKQRKFSKEIIKSSI